MGVVVVLVLGLGAFLAFDGITSRSRATPVASPWERRYDQARAGLLAGGVDTTPLRFATGVLATGGVAALLVAAVLGSWAIAGLAFVAAASAPVVVARGRIRTRKRRQRECWPEAVELLASALRAGETLSAAIGMVAERGPEPLRAAFGAIAADHRVTGELSGALERMATRLADPVADRVAITLATAARVGGTELGRVLRTLATFLRDDLLERRDLEARQSWTVVAARVAAAAPWIVLVLVAARPEGRAAFDSPAGLGVLVGGAAVTLLGYRLMTLLGRLPEEPRVLDRRP